jgi:hypothetical protein
MGYTNIQADVNFRRQVLNQDGLKYVTGPYTSYNQDDFRAFTAVTDCVVSCTSYVGDSLVGEIIYAGTTIYGLFSSITITSGDAILQLAGYSRISDLVNSYYNTAAQYGYYSEAQACTSQRLNPYLAGGLYDKASWLLIPSQVEEDFVRTFKPTDNSGSLTFTRASDATRTNSAGEIERTPWNLFQQSEMFSNVVWPKVNATIGIDVATAPNGTLTADKLIATVVNDQHRIDQTPTSTAVSQTFSVYAKAGEYPGIGLRLGTTGAGFNLTTGTVFSTSVGVTASIQSVGDGWYRCSITKAAGVANDIGRINISDGVTAATNFAGDGTSGIFIWGAQLVEGTDAKPYFPTTNRLDVPRLDYRNADGTVNSCPRLLLEPQRTNLVTFSEQFDTAAWAKAAASITANTTTSPDGTVDADTMTATATSTVLAVQTHTIVSNSAYAVSFYVKQNTQRYVYIRFTSNALAANYVSVVFDLQDGTVGETSLGTSSGTLISATTSIAANGFYRISLVASINRTDGNIGIGFATAKTGNTFNAIGTITSAVTNGNSIFAWGAQVEAGAYPTTYIPTTTAAVTRLADIFTRNNVFTNGLISAAGGTWFAEFSNNTAYTADTNTGAIFLDTSSFGYTNGFLIRKFTGNRLVISKYISTTGTSLHTTTADRFRVAIKWNGTTADVFVNGVKVVTATAFTTTAMQFVSNNTNPLMAFIDQSALFPAPLTDEECITLTTL